MSGTVWLCESVWMCRSMSLRLSLSVCLSVCVSLWLCAPKGECGSVRVYMCLCVFACVCVLLSGCGCGCLSVCLSGDVYYTRKTKSKAMRRSQVQIHILDNSNFILGYLMKVRSKLGQVLCDPFKFFLDEKCPISWLQRQSERWSVSMIES